MRQQQSRPYDFKLTILLSVLFYVFATALSFGQNTSQILFATDEFKVSTAEQLALKNLYNNSLINATSIQLIGHTDSDGTDGYNKSLSQKRVNEVKKELIALGCNPTQIKVDAQGEIAPLNANKNALEKQKNRRVEIQWQLPETITTGSIQDLYKLLEQEKQTFCINPKRDTFLVLEQGTLIFVPKATFRTNTNGCITIKAKEVYKFSDMLLENLSTISNSSLIETAGMVYTEAWDDNGNEVDLNFGKKITIMIPSDTLRSDMQLFSGNRNPQTNQMNWIPIGNENDFTTYTSGHDIDWCNPENFIPQPPACVRCGIFCRIGRIGRTIKGAGNAEIKAENKEFRACQKELRKKGENEVILYPYPVYCEDLLTMYGVSTYEQLRDTLLRIEEIMMQTEFDKYGVTTMEAYQDTLIKLRELQEKQTFEAAEQNIENGTGSMNDLKYYVAKVNRLGWINCDAFVRFPQDEKIDMRTDVPYNESFDCKLVFRDLKSIMRPDVIKNNFGYRRIPPNQNVWLMALKYENGQAFLSLYETTTQETAPKAKFRPVSIEELRTELKKLDQ